MPVVAPSASATRFGTLGRGVGVVSAGFLYEWFGIRGPAGLSATIAVACLVLLVAVGRRRPDLR